MSCGWLFPFSTPAVSKGWQFWCAALSFLQKKTCKFINKQKVHNAKRIIVCVFSIPFFEHVFTRLQYQHKQKCLGSVSTRESPFPDDHNRSHSHSRYQQCSWCCSYPNPNLYSGRLWAIDTFSACCGHIVQHNRCGIISLLRSCFVPKHMIGCHNVSACNTTCICWTPRSGHFLRWWTFCSYCYFYCCCFCCCYRQKKWHQHDTFNLLEDIMHILGANLSQKNTTLRITRLWIFCFLRKLEMCEISSPGSVQHKPTQCVSSAHFGE